MSKTMSSKCLVFLALFALVYAQNTSNSSEPVSTTGHNVTTPVAPVTNVTTISTTAAPITTANPNTTTIKPTPEPTPAPIPKTEKFDGRVTINNNTCVRVDFEVTVTIKYNNTEGHIKTAGFVIPANASVDTAKSHCSSNETETEAIAITFVNQENTSANLTLTFNKTVNGVALIKVDVSFNASEELLPGLDSKELGIVSATNDSLSLFKVASVHSYVCSAGQSAPLKIQGKSQPMITDVQIEFTNSKVEAYIDEKNKGSFDSEIDCKSADISDVVPIAVGAALAGLVVIVLIAYFIGRRRSRRLAYQSV